MKTLKLCLTISLLLSYFCIAQAQINNPVFGDAIRLLEILNKDYTQETGEFKQERIEKDRHEVIDIFKRYLTPDQKLEYIGLVLVTSINQQKFEIQKHESKISELESQIRSFVSTSDEDGVANFIALQTSLSSERESIRSKKENLEKDLYKQDSWGLGELIVKLDNDYLKHQIKSLQKKFKSIHENQIDIYASTNQVGSTQKSLPFVGGNLDLKTLMDGLSRFLGDRIKAELTNAFLKKVQDWMQTNNDESFQALTTLLPKTTAFFETFKADDLNYFSTSLKQHIENDLNDLLSNINGLKKLKSIQHILDLHPEAEFAFETIQFIPELKKSSHPSEIFSFLSNSSICRNWALETGQKEKYNLANGLKLVSLLNQSITIKDNNSFRYANIQEIQGVYDDPDFYRFFVGLLKQQNLKHYNISFINSANNTIMLNEVFKQLFSSRIASGLETNINSVKFIFHGLSDIVEEAQNVQDEFTMLKRRSKLNESIGKDTIITFFRGVVNLVDTTVSSTQKLANELLTIGGFTHTIDIKKKMGPYLKISSESINVIEHLLNKRYSNAILSGIDIYEYMRTDMLPYSKGLDLALGAETRPQDIIASLNRFPKKGKFKLTSQMKDTLADISDILVKIRSVHNIDAYLGTELVAKMNAFKRYLDLCSSVPVGREVNGPRTFEIKTILSNSKMQALFESQLIHPKVKSLIYLFNDFAQSESAEDVQVALERFALPVGSYSIKRKSGLDFSINSFPGLLMSIAEEVDGKTDWGAAASITAPVGFSMSRGEGKGVWGLYFPIIDIGAFTRYRFDSSANEKALPDFNFKNIFTVGAYLYYGFQNSPLTIMAGWQSGPEIRVVDPTATGGFETLDSARFSIGATLDIPIFKIFSN